MSIQISGRLDWPPTRIAEFNEGDLENALCIPVEGNVRGNNDRGVNSRSR